MGPDWFIDVDDFWACLLRDRNDADDHAALNLTTGERYVIEWGGVRLRIDAQQDPAVLFGCFT